MRIHLFFLLSLFYSNLFCQDDLMRVSIRQPREFSRKGIYIGIVGSPDYAYRTLYGISDGITIECRNKHEIPRLSFTAGISGLWQVKEKIGLEIGLFYSLKGEKTRTLNYYKDGSGLSMSTFNQTRYYNTAYLEIPLRFNYHLSKKKLSPYLFGGLSCNVFLHNRSKYYNTSIDGIKSSEVHNENVEAVPCGAVAGLKDNNFNIIDPQMQIGFGLDYTYVKFRFKIEPIFKYSLLDVNSIGSYNEHFYSVGLNLGVYYRIWKYAKSESH